MNVKNLTKSVDLSITGLSSSSELDESSSEELLIYSTLLVSLWFVCSFDNYSAWILVLSPFSSLTSIVIIGCPTAQIVSFLKLIYLIIPVAVEGIFATSLSVNTSQRSSY